MLNKPVTDMPEWVTLARHAQVQQDMHLRDMIANDADRFSNFSLALPGFLLDYSRQRVTGETLSQLVALAKACAVETHRDAMFSGAPINRSENRAVLHPALRGSTSRDIIVDNENIADFADSTLAQIKKLSDKIRSDRAITDILHIGIGGSDLGPRLMCSALAPMADGPHVHFLSNIDGQAFADIASTLDPKHTAVVIASKTFTTLETLCNARAARAWLATALRENKISNRLFAISSAVDEAKKFGIASDHVLPMRDWVGGRYSVWGSVGFAVALRIGFAHFSKMLEGARAADTHFKTAELARNAPVLMALLGIWNRNFLHMPSLAILPYANNLEPLIHYLQQVDMESNGKGTDLHGAPITCPTGPVIFGMAGTDSQHSFMQLMHQSPDAIPSDFIVAATSEHAHPSHHTHLMMNALAQAKALAEGRENLGNYARHFPGNRPSSLIVLDRIDPWHMGFLAATYEHKVFVQGVIWGINSFDQWGVELGKIIAKGLTADFESGGHSDLDIPSAALMDYIRRKR